MKKETKLINDEYQAHILLISDLLYTDYMMI